MTIRKHLSTLLLLTSAASAWAGDRAVVELEPGAPEPGTWEFKLAVPIWVASAWGQTGVRGKTANVDVSPGTVLRHLTFTTSLSAEARKDRFGIYTDYLYLGDQAGVYTPGLVSKLDLKFTETIADLDVSWRVVETSRGWLDILAGVRYMNIYSRLQLHPNDNAIDTTSVRLVDTASADIRRVIDKALKEVLDGQNPILPVPPLAGGLEQKLVDLIRKAKQDPELAAAIASGVPARIAQTKLHVANRIAGILKSNLSRAFSLNEDWFDPYIGLRARYNLTQAFYLTAKADVGGFGAGSQVSVEAIGAVGCQITRNLWAEAGYKYLYADYRHGGFVYDISDGGALLTVGVNF